MAQIDGIKLDVLYTPTITRRELFAAMAMQGGMADHTVDMSWRERAGDAVGLADALIAELDKGKP